MIETTFRDGPLNVGVQPHTLWVVQRALDAYGALTDAERSAVDAALDGTGWAPLPAIQPRHRLTKERNELVWER